MMIKHLKIWCLVGIFYFSSQLEEYHIDSLYEGNKIKEVWNFDKLLSLFVSTLKSR